MTPRGVASVCGWKRMAASAGESVSDTTMEMRVAAAMVMANCR